jgi:hypothetical protein
MIPILKKNSIITAVQNVNSHFIIILVVEKDACLALKDALFVRVELKMIVWNA